MLKRDSRFALFALALCLTMSPALGSVVAQEFRCRTLIVQGTRKARVQLGVFEFELISELPGLLVARKSKLQFVTTKQIIDAAAYAAALFNRDGSQLLYMPTVGNGIIPKLKGVIIDRNGVFTGYYLPIEYEKNTKLEIVGMLARARGGLSHLLLKSTQIEGRSSAWGDLLDPIPIDSREGVRAKLLTLWQQPQLDAGKRVESHYVFSSADGTDFGGFDFVPVVQRFEELNWMPQMSSHMAVINRNEVLPLSAGFHIGGKYDFDELSATVVDVIKTPLEALVLRQQKVKKTAQPVVAQPLTEGEWSQLSRRESLAILPDGLAERLNQACPECLKFEPEYLNRLLQLEDFWNGENRLIEKLQKNLLRTQIADRLTYFLNFLYDQARVALDQLTPIKVQMPRLDLHPKHSSLRASMQREPSVLELQDHFDLLSRKTFDYASMVSEVETAFMDRMRGVADREFHFSSTNTIEISALNREKVFAVDARDALAFSPRHRPSIEKNGPPLAQRYYSLILPKGFRDRVAYHLSENSSGHRWAQLRIEPGFKDKLFLTKVESGRLQLFVKFNWLNFEVNGKTTSQVNFLRDHILGVVEWDENFRITRIKYFNEP